MGPSGLGLYAMALAGSGSRSEHLRRHQSPGPVVAVIAIATFLVDFLVPALDLPEWLRRLALSADYGHPMVGIWEWAGVVVSVLVIARGPRSGGGDRSPRLGR